MPDQLQLRGGTTTEHNSFTGALREVTVDTTKKTLVVHDGASAGGTPLMKESGGNAASTVGIGVGGANKITINADGHVDIASNLDCAAGIDVTGAITGTGNLAIDTSTFFVNASNNFIGIGTATPTDSAGSGHCVDIKGGSSGTAIYLRDSSNNTGQIDFSNSNMTIRTRQATPILFNVNNSERMRIDSSGRLLIGDTSSDNSTSMLQIKRANNNTIRLANSDATATNFVALDLCPANSLIGARIVATADGTFSSSSAEDAHLKFFTTADGTSSERMRIASNGLVTIGDSASGSGASSASVGEGELVVGTTTGGLITACDLGSGEKLRIRGGGGSTSLGSISNHDLIFHTNGSGNERMRIDKSGGVRIGTTAGLLNGANNNFEQVSIKRTGQGNPLTLQRTTAISGFPVLYVSSVDTAIASQPFITFVREVNGEPLTVVGTIQTSTSATTYGTSSDYRLKENEVPISDGITRLKTLKPYRFNWKVDPSTRVDGFFAHEVTAVPEAVIGTKDEVSTDENGAIPKGKPIYQQIDQSKLVPLLVAAVQELIGKVEALEAA